MEDSLQVKISILLSAIIIAIIGVGFCYDRGILDDHNTVKSDEEGIVTTKDGEVSLSLTNAKFYNIYKALKDKSSLGDRENGISSFSYEERMEIAAKDLHKSDFTRTKKVFNETKGRKNYYYNLSRETVINILKKYFGKDAFIEGQDLVNDTKLYPLNVTYPEGSKMIITDYDKDSDNYEIRFTGSKEPTDDWIENSQIVSAKLKDNIITVEEKVIYYDKKEENNKVIISIYKDVEKNNKIDELTETKKNLKKNKIQIKKYIKDASTNTYTFNYDEEENTYYFEKSKIS